jgi:hypothetical protein
VTSTQDLPILCPTCGYDLRATTSGRCPECGSEIDEELLSGEATIPWQHRRAVGRVRAFLATLNWTLFHPARLAAQASRRVDYRAARRFQLICCLVGGAALAVAVTPDFWTFRADFIGLPQSGVVPVFPSPYRLPTAWDQAGDFAIQAALWLAMPVWLLLGTGVPSYFFHAKHLPRPLQDRGIAISYYAAAPLALLPLVVPLLWSATTFSRLNRDAGNQEPLFEALAWGVAGLLGLWCAGWTLLLPAYLLIRGQHATGGRVAALVATTLITWPLLLVVTLLLLPVLVFYVQFLWHLLR